MGDLPPELQAVVDGLTAHQKRLLSAHLRQSSGARKRGRPRRDRSCLLLRVAQLLAHNAGWKPNRAIKDVVASLPRRGDSVEWGGTHLAVVTLETALRREWKGKGPQLLADARKAQSKAASAQAAAAGSSWNKLHPMHPDFPFGLRNEAARMALMSVISPHWEKFARHAASNAMRNDAIAKAVMNHRLVPNQLLERVNPGAMQAAIRQSWKPNALMALAAPADQAQRNGDDPERQ
jgi:hypothetical protein